MRDRLIELCENVISSCKSSLCADCEHNKNDYPHCMSVHFADNLLADGWMRPPCKVGDVVYAKKGCFYLPHATRIKSDEIIACETIAIKETKKGKFLLLKPLIEEAFNMRSANGWFSFLAIGKTVFLTREDAEKVLKEGGKG